MRHEVATVDVGESDWVVVVVVVVVFAVAVLSTNIVVAVFPAEIVSPRTPRRRQRS